MVFLIQATNRDTLALQIKLSELILALEGARNELAAVSGSPKARSGTSRKTSVSVRACRTTREDLSLLAALVLSARCWAHWTMRKVSKPAHSRCHRIS